MKLGVSKWLLPVDGDEQQRGWWLDLANHLLEIIAAVAVENDELADPLAVQRHGDIPKHRRLRARIHVDAEVNVALAGLNAERNHREHDHPRASFPCDSSCLVRDGFSLDDIGPVR